MASTKVSVAKPKARNLPSRRFEIFANPQMNEQYTWQRADWSKATTGWEMSELFEKYGEEEVREKMTEVLKSYAGGMVITGLFHEGGMENRGKRPRRGCSLTHIWVGPGFPLFRHSHPGSGDCLYYVTNGELIVGRRSLGPGSGFFIPAGMPYKYTGGPNGAELLEFHPGGGDPEQPGMKVDERTMDSMQRLIDQANENRDKWHRPKRIGDTSRAEEATDDQGVFQLGDSGLGSNQKRTPVEGNPTTRGGHNG